MTTVKAFFWIRFYSLDTFGVNINTVGVDKLPDPTEVKFPREAFAFSLHKQEVEEEGRTVYELEAEKQVGPTYFHPDSRVCTLEEIEKMQELPETFDMEDWLIFMEENNFSSVILSRFGDHIEGFDPEKRVILPRQGPKKCPKCQSTAGFEEVMCGVTTTSLITIDSQGDIQYGIPETTGDADSQVYQCSTCGHVLEGITNFDEFAEWVRS